MAVNQDTARGSGTTCRQVKEELVLIFIPVLRVGKPIMFARIVHPKARGSVVFVNIRFKTARYAGSMLSSQITIDTL